MSRRSIANGGGCSPFSLSLRTVEHAFPIRPSARRCRRPLHRCSATGNASPAMVAPPMRPRAARGSSLFSTCCAAPLAPEAVAGPSGCLVITAGENEAHVLRLLRLTPPRQRPLFPVYPPAIAMKRVLFLSALILAGCGVTDNTDGLSALERAEYEAEIDATVRALEIAIGQARAEDVDACRELPLGPDACGNATSPASTHSPTATRRPSWNSLRSPPAWDASTTQPSVWSASAGSSSPVNSS